MIKQLTFIDFSLINFIEELGNYTRIAEKMHMTQPAISHRVSQIETLVGKPVATRIGKKIVLTEAGQLLNQKYHQFKGFYAEIYDELNNVDKDLNGSLTIGTSDTLGIHFLPKYLKQFSDLYPNVRLNLTSKPSRIVVREMQEGKIDLGIALTSAIGNQEELFEVHPLIERHDCIITSATSPLINKKKLSLIDLKEIPFITLDAQSQSRYFIVDWFKKRGIDIQIAMQLGSIEMVKKYVELDFGFSIVPELSIQTELKEKRLHKIDITDEVNFQTVAAFTVKNKYVTVIAKKFIEFLVGKME